MAKLKNSKPPTEINTKPTENKGHQAKRSQRIKNDSPMAKIKNSKTNEIKNIKPNEAKGSRMIHQWRN
jgi:hypothetical protein